MESLFIALNTVLPLFLMMALGYVVKLTGLLNEGSARQVNKLIFKTFLPLLVFINVYDSDLQEGVRSSLLLFSVAGVLIQFLVALVLVLLTEPENARRGLCFKACSAAILCCTASPSA